MAENGDELLAVDSQPPENNEQPPRRKSRWTRWYMWFLYGSLTFLLIAIIAALMPDNSTPEERVAHLEATQTAESLKATRQFSEQQTKEAGEHFAEQTKTATELHKQQTKEAEEASKQQTKTAEDNPDPKTGYCTAVLGNIASIATNFQESLEIVLEAERRPSGSTQAEVDRFFTLAIEAALYATILTTIETPDERVETRRLASKLRDLERTIDRYSMALDNRQWNTAWSLLKDGITPILISAHETATEYCETA